MKTLSKLAGSLAVEFIRGIHLQPGFAWLWSIASAPTIQDALQAAHHVDWHLVGSLAVAYQMSLRLYHAARPRAQRRADDSEDPADSEEKAPRQ